MVCTISPLLASSAFADTRETIQHIDVQARPIVNFHIGRDETRFGELEFIGGLELTARNADFGALSAFRFLKPGSDFIGVADTGFWYFGSIARDAAMKPTGISDFTMQQFVDASGQPVSRKWLVDAEGLAVKNGVATVGFEREHRIAEFKIRPRMGTPFRQLDFLVPRHELRQNRGFETVTYAPRDSALQGALVIVSEKSLDKNGNIFAAVLGGPRKGIFTIKRSDRFDITDGAFLPDGDLLLLERAFSMATGVGMRLRRIPGELIAGGADALDGEVLIEADMAYQIDNMESMDVWQRGDGATVVSLLSDDNHSMLQRNLYLEFVLHDEPTQ